MVRKGVFQPTFSTGRTSTPFWSMGMKLVVNLSMYVFWNMLIPLRPLAFSLWMGRTSCSLCFPSWLLWKNVTLGSKMLLLCLSHSIASFTYFFWSPVFSQGHQRSWDWGRQPFHHGVGKLPFHPVQLQEVCPCRAIHLWNIECMTQTLCFCMSFDMSMGWLQNCWFYRLMTPTFYQSQLNSLWATLRLGKPEGRKAKAILPGLRSHFSWSCSHQAWECAASEPAGCSVAGCERIQQVCEQGHGLKTLVTCFFQILEWNCSMFRQHNYKEPWELASERWSSASNLQPAAVSSPVARHHWPNVWKHQAGGCRPGRVSRL